jgi:putative sterol carrier protein
MVWNSRDILSSFVLGNVKTEANLEEKLEFISWFTDLQVKLRWVGKSKMQVPRLRHAIQDWMEEDERRLDRFKELYADGTILYVGDKKRAGLKLRFSDSSILDVTLGLDSQEKYNFEMLIPGKEVDKIFSGEVNLLHEILANREIKFKSAEKAKFEIDPQTFFENMKKDFNPKKATGVNLLIQYRIDTDQAEENWWVQIKDHAIKIEKGINDKKPSVELYIKMNNFLKLINRFLTPMELFSGGNITYKGSPYFMLDLIKCLDDSTYETPGPVKPSLQSN